MVDVRFIDVYMVLREAKVYVIAVRARYERGEREDISRPCRQNKKGETHLNIPRERDGLVVGNVFDTGNARALGRRALAKTGNLAEKALLTGCRDWIQAATARRGEDGGRWGLLGVELFGMTLRVGCLLEDATGSRRWTAKRRGS